MQPSHNTFTIPASPEVAQYEQQKLYEEALDAAIGRHEIDADDVDRRRIEGFGASMVAAAETVPAEPRQEFSYTDPRQLNMVAPAVLHVRRAAIEASKKQGDYGLAA